VKKQYGLKNKYTKALVTGGAGFIGSHLAESLLDEGLEVVSVDNYIAGKHENIAHLLGNPKFTEVNCDITDRHELQKYFDGVDIVFHQAASKKTVCLKDPLRDLQVNGGGAFNVMELSREYCVKKVVHASTGSVYGEPYVIPQTEDHPLSPNSYYGVSKLAGERYADAFRKLYGLNVTILRYFHVYGERQEYNQFGGVIPIFCRKLLQNTAPVIYGDGSQLRSFTYVDDIVNINKLAAIKDEANGEVYNCCSAIQVSVAEMAEMIKRYMGKSDIENIYEDWAIGDIKYFRLDNSKVKKLGYNEFIDFEQGLQNTIEWMKGQIG